jgi:hypothetical protein
MMGMRGIEGDVSAGPGRSGRKNNSDRFFSLAQIIPINPLHPHHFGNFDTRGQRAEGSTLPRRGREVPGRLFAWVLPEGAGLTGRARALHKTRQ